MTTPTTSGPTHEGPVRAAHHWGDVTDLIAHLDLHALGAGVYEAPAYGSQARDVIEGSHLLGHAIVAATRTSGGQRVVSAHGVFSRAASYGSPVRFETSFSHQGRTFSAASVAVSQQGKAIASTVLMLAGDAPDYIRQQVAMPDVPGPEDCPAYDLGISGRDLRVPNGDYTGDPDAVGPPELHAWMRFREAPGELCLRQALLAQFMGRLTVSAAMRPHKGVGEAMAHVSLSTGVLNQTIALHEDPDLSDWLLYSSSSIYAGRGLAQVDGRVFERSGRLVASAVTQVMIRPMQRDVASVGGPARVL